MRKSLYVLAMLALAATVGSAAAQTPKDSAVIGMTLEPRAWTRHQPVGGGGRDRSLQRAGRPDQGQHGRQRDAAWLAKAGASTPTASATPSRCARGVKFHDGESFDASDVKLSFERAKAKAA